MDRSIRIAIALGGAIGAASGLAVVALAAGRVLNAGVDFVPGGAGSASPSFVVTQAGMYLLVAVAGALAGALLGLVGYAIGRVAHPEATRFGVAPLAALGGVVGSMLAFAGFRSLAGLMGDVVDGMVTLTVFRAIVVAIVIGALAGAITAGAVQRMSRPEVFGFGGAAWPATSRSFVRDAVSAVGIPLLGLAIGASVVFLFARALLDSDTEVGLVLFGGIAAVILIGAAVVASRTGRSNRGN